MIAGWKYCIVLIQRQSNGSHSLVQCIKKNRSNMSTSLYNYSHAHLLCSTLRIRILFDQSLSHFTGFGRTHQSRLMQHLFRQKCSMTRDSTQNITETKLKALKYRSIKIPIPSKRKVPLYTSIPSTYWLCRLSNIFIATINEIVF